MLLTSLLFVSTSSVKNESSVAAGIILLIFAIVVFLIASIWKVFSKAGRPGWAAIIPFYSNYVLFEIAGLSGWLGVIGSLLVYFASDQKSTPLLLLVFAVYLVLYLFAAINLSKKFGKGLPFAIIGLTILPFVGYPYLAFSDAKYKFAKSVNKTS